jgi:hypothetical protein
VAEPAEESGHPFTVVSCVIEDWAGGATAGTVGAATIDPAELAKGDTPGVATGAAELTPALLISDESSGMPVRGTPPMVTDEVDGVDDAITLLEPDPHIPDMPEVSIVAEIPDVGDIAAAMPGVAAVVPAIPPVAGATDPAPVPPPSNIEADPNMPAGADPTVAHTAPSPGMAIVPVAGPASGLTPADWISVAPSGIPTGETGEPAAPPPSGEVASTVDSGIAIVAICAYATLPASSAGTIVATNETLMVILRCQLVQSQLSGSDSVGCD